MAYFVGKTEPKILSFVQVIGELEKLWAFCVCVGSVESGVHYTLFQIIYIIDRWQMQQEDYNLKSISFDLGGSRHQTV